MSQFTQFELDTPIVIPSTTEKVFDKQWLSQFRVAGNSKGKTTLTAILVPYNGEETISSPSERVFIGDLFGMLTDETLPTEIKTGMAQAMDGVFQALKAYKTFKNANPTN